jgi:hypothetical protein
MSPGWILSALFVAAVVVVLALASRRQRLHGGSRRFDQTFEDTGFAGTGSAPERHPREGDGTGKS